LLGCKDLSTPSIIEGIFYRFCQEIKSCFRYLYKLKPFVTKGSLSEYIKGLRCVNVQKLILGLVKGLAIAVLMVSLASPTWAAGVTASVQPTALFEVHCAGCHLNGGNIIRRGKNLKLKALQKNGVDSVEAIATLIANGKNNMSAYRDKLCALEINALADYILVQAQQGWAKG
jgi:cytochrome c6